MNRDDALVDALAAYRLTRLATADVITRPLRARLIALAYERREQQTFGDGRIRYDPLYRAHGQPPLTEAELDGLPENDDDAPKLADFVKCRWCAGMWISGFVVVARRYAPRVWDPLARALALSAAAALIAGLEQ